MRGGDGANEARGATLARGRGGERSERATTATGRKQRWDELSDGARGRWGERSDLANEATKLLNQKKTTSTLVKQMLIHSKILPLQ